MTQTTTTISGYTYGTHAVAPAPISTDDFELLKQSVLFSDADIKYLRMSRIVLEDQVEAVLDVWYGFVAAHPHLVYYFGDKDTGAPLGDYLGAVRKRFARWILDTASADYGQAWLDYQFEIGRRHHRTAKNTTDSANSADIISFRYLPAFIYPITATLRPFLSNKGHSAAEVDAMHQAWLKSVILQVILWSYPYVKDGDF